MPSGAKSPSAVVGERLRALRTEHGWQQDDIADAARRQGLRWTQATVAAIESGRRELAVGELLILPWVLATHPLGVDVSFVDLFPVGDYMVHLGPQAAGSGNDVRATIIGAMEEVVHLDTPWRRAADETMRKGLALWEAGKLAEVRLAGRLGIEPLELAELARTLWGRGLTLERERRVSELVAADADAKVRSATAGHVTRTLTAELRSALDARPVTKKKRKG